MKCRYLTIVRVSLFALLGALVYEGGITFVKRPLLTLAILATAVAIGEVRRRES